jgi:hypothetical protein
MPEANLTYWRVVLVIDVMLVPTRDEGGLKGRVLLPELAGHAVHVLTPLEL